MEYPSNCTCTTPETGTDMGLVKVYPNPDSLSNAIKCSNNCTRTIPETDTPTELVGIYIGPDSFDFELPGSVLEPDVLYSVLFAILLKTCLFLEWFFTISSLEVSIIWHRSSTSTILQLYLTWCHNRLGHPLDPFHYANVFLYADFDHWTSILTRRHPELALPMEQFLESFITTVWELAALFDMKPNSTGSSDLELLHYFECFVLFGFYALMIIPTMLNSSRDTPVEACVTRITLYLNSLAVETQSDLKKNFRYVAFLPYLYLTDAIYIGRWARGATSFFQHHVLPFLFLR